MTEGSVYLHSDPDMFRESLSYSERNYGFPARLIEKDYYCSLVLRHLFSVSNTPLIFKGGTCLSKVHAGFHRLSEDLDFSIPILVDAGRADRSKTFRPVKKRIEEAPECMPGIFLSEAPEGHNQSREYTACLQYQSVLADRSEQIMIEVGIREPLLLPPQRLPVHTMAVNPLAGVPALPVFNVPVIALLEAYAEKLRAALTRREPAIRDFYDLHHALRAGMIPVGDPEFVKMVQKKLDVPGNDPVDVTDHRRQLLARQVAAQLKPVLRPNDFEKFALGEAFAAVQRFAKDLVGLRN